MKVLESFEFKEFGARGEKRDYDTLLDGRIRELTQGEDFQCKVSTFCIGCRKAAKAKGLKVRLSAPKDGDTVVLQAVNADGTSITPPKAKPKK